MNEGYVFIAYGEKYINQALSLLKTIKLFDRRRKYILISNVKCNLFDENIDISDEFVNESDNHNKYCIIARIVTPKYINLEKFLMIDTDILCLNNIENIWDTFKKTNNCFNCIGGRDGSKWHWGYIDDINKKLNTNMKPMHGGLLYFNKGNKNFSKYVDYLFEGYKNYDTYGFKRLFRGDSMTDEILFSYASDKLNIIPHDYIKYPFVSFCLSDKINIKDKIVTWGQGIIRTNNFTILNHFTGLNDGSRINSLYTNWKEKIDNYYIKMDNKVTCVTGLFNIERESKGDGRKWEDYINWFKETIKLNVAMIIYCEKDTYEKIKDVRDRYPLTKIIIMKLKDIYYLKYVNEVNEIVKDKDYLSKIMGSERLEIKHPIYNLLIMNKIKLLNLVAKKNYFNSSIFLWIDAGCSRFFDNINILNNWPNSLKLDKNKMNIQIKNSIFNNISLDKLLYHNDHFTTATIFGGGEEIVNFFDNEIYKEFKYMLSKKCINNEQIILAILFKKFKNKFNYYLNNTNKHLPYFKYLSNYKSL